ncbi:MAG: Stp1/IreP family PP2C-type Ser/Thr phosphatase [Oscillospiraceae bacterium]|nr:Stp1/IreP family PP2C-type Ser/Thr phosphatase [Oscillospiraceae bacterium]
MFNVFGLSDKGRFRAENQDSFDVSAVAGGLLAVVCDGMGGAAAGLLASDMARARFMAFARSALETSDGTDTGDILRQAADAANRKIYSFASHSEEYAGMGTTLVGVFMREDTGVFVNVGDSRAYRIAKDGIVQITKDHSLVQMMVDSGQITPDQGRHHPRRNIITRAVGSERFVTSDIFTFSIRPGDRFLLCSDGLTNAMEDAELHRLILAAGDAQTACRALVNEAVDGGARDNVTAIVIYDRKGDA